jgi:2-isopropylmalate synthase
LKECDEVVNFKLDDFSEKTLGHDADATAIAFIGLRLDNGAMVYGAGCHSNIDRAAINALFSALNRATN